MFGCHYDDLFSHEQFRIQVCRFADNRIRHFFAIALITALLIFVITGEYDTISKIKGIPVYLYLPGAISVFMILGTTFLIPKIGAKKFFILRVSGQIIMAIIVGHFGILGSSRDLMALKKYFGAALVIAGVFFTTI